MKKKAIEKIPYLGLKQVSSGQDVKYIGVTALKIVGHEKHLLLEVYRNEKESMNIPVVRIAVTKKDFGTYRTDQDIWTREKIAKDYYYGATLVWDKAGGRTERNARAKSNILASEEDMQRIEKFCGKNGWYKSEWWEHIYQFQSSIVHEERRRRENRKYERRQQALKDRQEHTPELPEAEILEMADRFYFHQKHFLYYKKRGCRVRIACTKCGGVTEAEHERTDSEPERGVEELAAEPQRDSGVERKDPERGEHEQERTGQPDPKVEEPEKTVISPAKKTQEKEETVPEIIESATEIEESVPKIMENVVEIEEDVPKNAENEVEVEENVPENTEEAEIQERVLKTKAYCKEIQRAMERKEYETAMRITEKMMKYIRRVIEISE